jgi:hypothetical protein
MNNRINNNIVNANVVYLAYSYKQYLVVQRDIKLIIDKNNK